jgi:hypothetical protein
MNDAPPTARPAANAPPRRGRILSLLAIIGSGVMIPLGIGIFGLGLLPSDMPQFFLLLGLHVIASGGLGLLHPLTKGTRRTPPFAAVRVGRGERRARRSARRVRVHRDGPRPDGPGRPAPARCAGRAQRRRRGAGVGAAEPPGHLPAMRLRPAGTQGIALPRMRPRLQCLAASRATRASVDGSSRSIVGRRGRLLRSSDRQRDKEDHGANAQGNGRQSQELHAELAILGGADVGHDPQQAQHAEKHAGCGE